MFFLSFIIYLYRFSIVYLLELNIFIPSHSPSLVHSPQDPLTSAVPSLQSSAVPLLSPSVVEVTPNKLQSFASLMGRISPEKDSTASPAPPPQKKVGRNLKLPRTTAFMCSLGMLRENW